MHEFIASIGSGSSRVAPTHRLACSLARDNLVSPGILAYSSLGANGRHSQNVERDLHRWLGGLYGVSILPHMLKLHLCVPGHDDPQPVDLPIFAPHDWMIALYKAGRLQWERSACGAGNEACVLNFWEWAISQPWGSQHPVMSEPRFLDKMIPWAVHTDGAEAYTASEAIIWSMSSMVSKTSRSVWDSKLLLCLVMERSVCDATVKDNAFEIICNFLAWSFKCCQQGIAPTLDFYGLPFPKASVWQNCASTQLANGWHGCYTGWKGDRKERKNLHHLHRNYNSTFICEHCLAVAPYKKCTCPELSYADMSQTALWRQTVMTHADFMRTAVKPSPFACIPGFHLGTLWEDLMHTVHLGIGKDLVGSILGEFVLENLGVSGQQTLSLKHLELQTYCALNRLKCPPRALCMKLISWGSSCAGYPILSSVVKAAHTKILLFWCADVTYHAAICAHSRLRNTCSWGMADFLLCLDVGEDIMNPELTHRAVRSAYTFAKTYQELSRTAELEGKALWKIRPKGHYFMHLVDSCSASNRNPNSHHCFGEEDFMGVVTRIASGTHGATTMLRTLQRYMMFMALRFEQQRQV